jgi:hypothetical protein
VRHYDGGVIVGEPDPTKDLHGFFVWLDSELATMTRLIEREERGTDAMGYLLIRKKVLIEVFYQMRGLRADAESR